MRPSGRNNNQLRNIKIQHKFTKYAEGSVLIEFGDTRVICTASIITGVPRFKKGSGQGWLTAEYSMLPRSTQTRVDREAVYGKQSGRTQEIQRLIGRSLRSSIDLSAIGENTIKIDCDVIQADGSTRVAAITGAFLAVNDAINYMKESDMITAQTEVLLSKVAAVSVGIYNDQPVLDLDYNEDLNAKTDMNIVMNSKGGIIEIQGTAENNDFSEQEFAKMLNLAKKGIGEIFALFCKSSTSLQRVCQFYC